MMDDKLLGIKLLRSILIHWYYLRKYIHRRMFTSIVVVSGHILHLSQTLTLPQQCEVQWNSVPHQHHQKCHSNCSPIPRHTRHISKWTQMMSCESYLSLGGARCRKWGCCIVGQTHSHNEYKSGGVWQEISLHQRQGHSEPGHCTPIHPLVRSLQHQLRW